MATWGGTSDSSAAWIAVRPSSDAWKLNSAAVRRSSGVRRHGRTASAVKTLKIGRELPVWRGLGKSLRLKERRGSTVLKWLAFGIRTSTA